MAKGENYPVPAICPRCGCKGRMYLVHFMKALILVKGLNCHGGSLVEDIGPKHLNNAEDSPGGVYEYECGTCSRRCTHAEMVDASLKKAGLPNLMNISLDFQEFWKEQRKKYGPLDTEMEIIAWNAWQSSRKSAEKGNP